jgi:hypothetical protein
VSGSGEVCDLCVEFTRSFRCFEEDERLLVRDELAEGRALGAGRRGRGPFQVESFDVIAIWS